MMHLNLYYIVKVRLHTLTYILSLSLFSINSYSITIEESISAAIEIDPQLRISKFNYQISQEGISQATSRLLPQVVLQGTLSKLAQTTTQELPLVGNISRSFQGPAINHQIVLRQAIIHSKEVYSLELARLQAKYMELRYRLDESELRSRVLTSWLDLVAAQHIVAAYEEPLHLMKEAALQEKMKFEKGDGTKDYVIEAEALYQNSLSNYIQSCESLKVKQIAYEKLTGLSASLLGKKVLTFESIQVYNDVQKIELLKNLKDTALEIQILKLQEQIQLEKIRLAESDHHPTLDLIASINVAKNDATSTQGYQYKNNSIGLQYNIPLYMGGGVSASVRQAKLGYQVSIAETEAAVLKYENDFYTTWSQVAAGKLRVGALHESLLAIDEQLRGAIRSFELGVKTIAEKAFILNVKARRQVELIIAVQEFHKNEIKLKKFDVSKLNVSD